MSRLKIAGTRLQTVFCAGPVTTLLSILCVLMQTIRMQCANKNKKLQDLKFRSFIGRFSSDIMAVNGLKKAVENSSSSCIILCVILLVFFMQSQSKFLCYS